MAGDQACALDPEPGAASPRESLPALLARRARTQPGRVAYRFLPDDHGPVAELRAREWTYAQLHDRVAALSLALRPVTDTALEGDPPRVLLAFAPGLEFVAAFLACLQAGAVAVPMPTPRRRDDVDRWQGIVGHAQAAAVLTTRDLRPWLAPLLGSSAGAITFIETDEIGASRADRLDQPVPSLHSDADRLAFLQYTSGSTRRPRGVQITHGNLAHNLGRIEALFGHDEHSHGVIWLPPHHDMGLIGGLLQPLFSGFPVTLMSPHAFLQRPLRWLEAISHVGATTSGGPNFAYEHCLSRLSAGVPDHLDLSRWSVAFVGAEPVRHPTLARFAEALASRGFSSEAFLPCYGLAEATLLVSGERGQPRHLVLDRAALETHRVVPAGQVDPAEGSVVQSGHEQRMRGITLVSCGPAVAGMDLAIVDPASGQPSAAGQVGEVWLAGPSVSRAYWRADADDAAQMSARMSCAGAGDAHRFARTGDLGFLHDGRLFITGRLRDLVILRGRNFAPQDLESCVERSHQALASGGAAAFTAEGSNQETGLVILAEVERVARHGIDADAVLAAVRAALSSAHGVQAATVVLIKPLSLPRTPSGKLRRHQCGQSLREGSLAVLARWDLPSTDSRQTPLPCSAASQSSQQAAATRFGDDAAPLLDWLRDYAGHAINSRLMDERRSISPSVVLDFGNQGLLGMQVPPTWGGLGLSHAGFLRVIGQLAAIDPTLGLFVGLNNVLGVGPILRHAAAPLRDELLPHLASGRELAAFALTEQGAGSHPHAMQASARPREGGGWLLQGHKVWSGSAAWAGVINVFVRQHDAAGQGGGISAFAVRKGQPGLRQGPEAMTMGMRAMVQNSVHLDDVAVQPSHLLGRAGEGMAVAQDAMMYGRLTIAAACVGGMKRCAQLMLRYAGRRHIATGRLLDQPVLQARLSDIVMATDAIEALVACLADRLDRGLPVPETAYTACKVLAPELYWQAADHLVQCLGGRGYIESNLVPQILRDARVLRIFEGPTEAMTAYLGACARHHGGAIESFLRQELGAAPAASAMRELLTVIASRPDRWLLPAVGEAAAWAFVWGALGDVGSLRTGAWVQQRFDHALSAVRAHGQTPTPGVQASELERWISGYTASIGDIEQALAGEDHAPDAWLKREPAGPEQASQVPPGASWVAVGSGPGHQGSAGHPATGATAHGLVSSGVLRWLTDWLSTRLNLPPRLIDPHRALAELGIDSVLAVEMAHALEETYTLATPLDATLAWSHPTLAALAAHIAGLTVGPASTPTTVDADTARSRTEAITADQASGDEFDDLSDDELARLLAAELDPRGSGR